MPLHNNVGTGTMSRKKKHEEHENHERWLISYADFITLLFAFFVVMYSISSVNEGKYRVLSDSISSAFSGADGAKPIKLGDPIKTPVKGIVAPEVNRAAQEEARRARAERDLETKSAGDEQQARELSAVADEVDAGLKELIDEKLITVNRDKAWVEIDINTSILFGSGSAALQTAAQPVLHTLAKILNEKKYNIQVEGFTDNVPIKSEVFPSNWELSSARAASVVRVFVDEGVSPQRLVAMGFGEHRPVSDNNSEEGRSKNRRVRIVILPPTQDARGAAAQSRMFGDQPAVSAAPKSAPAIPGVELSFPE